MTGAIILQIILISLNAIFASAEIAVISMNDNKLKRMADSGDKRAAYLVALTEQPARFLATIQVAITLAGLLGSAFAADNFAEPLVGLLVDLGVGIPESVLHSASVIVITLVLAYFNLVFGELVPKRIGMKKCEGIALGLAGLLNTVSKVFKPIVFILTASTNGILKLLRINPDEEDEVVSEEEIRMMLVSGKQQGVFTQGDAEIIENVFAFDDIDAEQICTHRMDVEWLSTEDKMEEWERIIFETGYRFFPVCGETIDDITGVLDTKDYFRLKDKSREVVMAEAVEKPYFVPETMKANVLFRKMQEEGKWYAVVIDEYGGLSGIITLYDLIEELVGDIREDDEEPEREDILKTGDMEWEVQGTADLEDVANALHMELPLDTYDTFGGYLCGLTGRIPEDGETFDVEFGEYVAAVQKTENRRIVWAKVTAK
ncbi:MAG: HlyC/CorC family transporter [Firmicutes bacterium]|nr:HlyC/CorC family transporter [Bacillota bacterium]